MQVDLDVEHWLQVVLAVVRDADLVGEVLHGALNTFGDALDDESVDVVDVGEPSARLLVWLDVFHGVLHELLDLLAVVLDVFKSWHLHRLMELDELIRWPRLDASLVEWLLPLYHEVLHLVHIVLHLFDQLIDVFDDLHGGVDEGINVLAIPLELSDAWHQRLVHPFDPVVEQWLLNWKKSRENAIVHVNDDLQVASLRSVRVDLLVEERGALRYFVILLSQVLDLTEQLDEDGVEVDANEALLGQRRLLSVEQRLVELVLGIALNTLLPDLNLALVVLLDVVAERGIKLLDILELFAVLD